jgi:hypothetical protein
MNGTRGTPSGTVTALSSLGLRTSVTLMLLADRFTGSMLLCGRLAVLRDRARSRDCRRRACHASTTRATRDSSCSRRKERGRRLTVTSHRPHGLGLLGVRRSRQ